MRVFLICYADGRAVHLRNQEALIRSARRKGFDRVFAYRRHDLTEDFRRAHRHILDLRRGAGYWLWKPYLIQETLRRAQAGDVVIYLDAGMIVRRPLDGLIDEAVRSDLVVFRGSRPNAMHVKRDCFVLTETDMPECHAALQIDASCMVIKNTEANRQFVRIWLDYCADARILTDRPNECAGPNLSAFIDHRHDQAILSVLYWRERERLPHVVRGQRFKREYLMHHRRRRRRVPIPVWHYGKTLRRWWRNRLKRLWAIAHRWHPPPPALPGPRSALKES